jgi:hypothetical protein
MQPPSPLATTLTTLSCIGLVVWTFVSHGRGATSGLAVMSFAVLSLQLLGTEKPRFSQLTSSVFGLFYCGACGPLTVGESSPIADQPLMNEPLAAVACRCWLEHLCVAVWLRELALCLPMVVELR